MKKVQLDNSGVVVEHRSLSNSAASRAVRPKSSVTTTQHKPITAEFIREIKSELVRELAALLSNAAIVAKGAINKSGEISAEPATMFKPITIDDSIVVTEVPVGDIQKGFLELTEAKVTKDEGVSISIDKLRSIKKRS